jgi:hypothetical protein
LRYRQYINSVGWDWITVMQDQPDIFEVKKSNERSVKSGKMRNMPWEWRQSERKRKNSTRKGIEMNCLGYAFKSSVWTDHIAKIFVCLCMCRIHTAVKWMSSNWLVWRRHWSAMCLGRAVDYWCVKWAKKKCSSIKGFLILCLNIKSFHEVSWVKTGSEVPHYRLYGFGLYSFSSYTLVLLEHSWIWQQVFCVLKLSFLCLILWVLWR